MHLHNKIVIVNRDTLCFSVDALEMVSIKEMEMFTISGELWNNFSNL